MDHSEVLEDQGVGQMNEGRLPQQLRRRSLPLAPDPYEYQDDYAGWGGEVELREYWRIVMKYRLLIAAGTILAVLVALIYVFTVTPRYTAAARMRISTYEPVLTATKIENILEQKSKDSLYLETQIQEIRSLSLADRVLENEAIGTLVRRQVDESRLATGTERSQAVGPYGRPVYRHTLPMIENYLQLISVKPIRKTSLVEIEAKHRDPQAAALIANTHTDAYIDWVRVSRIEQQSRGLTFLRAQAEELREKVADLERELADYAEENSIVALNKDENIVVRKMADLNRLLTEVTARRIEVASAYEEILANRQGLLAYDDASVQNMRSDLARLEAEHSQLSAKFTTSYPRVQQLAAQVGGLKKSISQHEDQIVSGLRSKAEAVRQEEETLREELEQQKSLAFELSKREVQYNILNRELNTSRELLQSVMRQSKETSLAVESNASNVSVVDYALAPTRPSFPNKRLILFLGLLCGMAGGLALAFLLNYLDNTLRTPEDLENYLSLPSLGVVPSFDLEGLPGGPTNGNGADGAADGETALVALDPHSPIVFLENPKSLASEAYRTIRTGILLSQAGEPPRTLLVTSAQSAEGKTTTTINLAASLTGAGGRVVLIDADLRRPSVLKYFRDENNVPGLVEVLTGQVPLEGVKRHDLLRRLTVIPSGNIPPNPAELLGSMEMATLVNQLARDYDYVLLDCPPILPVTDAVILSRYVDGVVLVVKGGSTPKRVVADAKARLATVGANVLGVILNDVDVTGGDYYYYSRYYYSYYHDGEGSERLTASAN